MSDSTPRTPGNEAPAAEATVSAAASANHGAEVTKAFEREASPWPPAAATATPSDGAFELAITLAVMVGLGLRGLDHLFGTAPVFIIVLSVLGFAGIGVKLKLGYDLEMAEHEDGAIWNRKPGATA